MADIKPPDAEKEGQAVQGVTETVPSDADATSSPSAAPDTVNRPPVSTNRSDVPIAQTLVAGAGAPQPPSADELPLPLEGETEVMPAPKSKKASS